MVILPCTFLELEHVNVLQSRRRISPLPTNQPPVILGSAIPPVPPSLVEKIETGKFIEMGDLVPSHLGFEETNQNNEPLHVHQNGYRHLLSMYLLLPRSNPSAFQT